MQVGVPNVQMTVNMWDNSLIKDSYIVFHQSICIIIFIISFKYVWS